MAQNRKFKGIARLIEHTPNETRFYYHDTAVVVKRPEDIVLSSGGWRTNTTKTAINQAANEFSLGFQVHQKDFDWFVDDQHNGVENIPFVDGLVLPR